MEKPSVFISYSMEAKPWAEKLCDALEEKGVETWSDFRDIQPGGRMIDEIRRAASISTVFVIVVGPKYDIGQWQDRECQEALERSWTDPKVRLIPVLVDNAEPPGYLQNWVPVRVKRKTRDASWIDPIVKAIQSAAEDGPGRRIDPHPKPSKEFWDRIKKMERVAKQLKARRM